MGKKTNWRSPLGASPADRRWPPLLLLSGAAVTSVVLLQAGLSLAARPSDHTETTKVAPAPQHGSTLHMAGIDAGAIQQH